MKHFPRETKLDFDEVLNLYFQGKLFLKTLVMLFIRISFGIA